MGVIIKVIIKEARLIIKGAKVKQKRQKRIKKKHKIALFT